VKTYRIQENKSFVGYLQRVGHPLKVIFKLSENVPSPMFGQLNQQTLRRFNVKGSYVEIGAAPADLNYEVATAEEF
jgi:hypothetical protein